MASNPIFDINGDTLDRLRSALHLGCPKGAQGYAIDHENGRMVLFRSACPAMTPFSGTIGVDGCALLIDTWLSSSATYPPQPDMDGSVAMGWRVRTGKHGHIDPYGWPACIAIEPIWMEHAK